MLRIFTFTFTNFTLYRLLLEIIHTPLYSYFSFHHRGNFPGQNPYSFDENVPHCMLCQPPFPDCNESYLCCKYWVFCLLPQLFYFLVWYEINNSKSFSEHSISYGSISFVWFAPGSVDPYVSKVKLYTSKTYIMFTALFCSFVWA